MLTPQLPGPLPLLPLLTMLPPLVLQAQPQIQDQWARQNQLGEGKAGRQRGQPIRPRPPLLASCHRLQSLMSDHRFGLEALAASWGRTCRAEAAIRA